MNPPPTLAAARAAMKNLDETTTAEELEGWGGDPRWDVVEVLTDHIRAIAGEMRKQEELWPQWDAQSIWSLFREFADKLEGKQ